MDIRNPEYFLEIARQKNLTRAADRLFVTQSTLSQYLQKLESEAQTPLFLRDKGSLELTDAGRIYMQAAADIVHIRDAAQDSLDALRGEGSIRIGCSSWGLELAARCLPDFKARFPGVKLRLFEHRLQQLRTLLHSGKCDLAIMAVTAQDDLPAQGYTPLCREELVLVLPADLPFCTADPARTTVDASLLATELHAVSFISSNEGTTIRKLEEQLFADLMFRPNVVCEINRDELSQKMVDAGVGAAIVPLADIRGFANVRPFRLDPPLYREEILVRRQDLELTEPIAYLEQLLQKYTRADSRVTPL